MTWRRAALVGLGAVYARSADPVRRLADCWPHERLPALGLIVLVAADPAPALLMRLRSALALLLALASLRSQTDASIGKTRQRKACTSAPADGRIGSATRRCIARVDAATPTHSAHQASSTSVRS